MLFGLGGEWGGEWGAGGGGGHDAGLTVSVPEFSCLL